MGLISLGAGVALGYFLGTQTGREKIDAGYDAVKKKTEEFWEREDVQDFATKAGDTATRVTNDVAEGAKAAATAASDALKNTSETTSSTATSADEPAAAEDIIDEPEEAEATAQATANWKNEGGAAS